jgi:hypothetical protein
MFVVSLGMVLENYPDAVIREATHPVSGIVRQCKWPPSIAEFSEFCEELKRRSEFGANWEMRSKKQLAEREKFERDAKAESQEHRDGVVDRVQREMAAAGMRLAGDKNKYALENAETLKEKYNLTDGQWDSIPDIKISRDGIEKMWAK